METESVCKKDVQLDLAVEILRGFGELQFRARGTSMAPAIMPGDILYVERRALADVRSGQVVLFYGDGRFCAHRVVRTGTRSGRPCITTQGDALIGEDPDVFEENLLGQVTTVIRGYKQFALKNPGVANFVTRKLMRRSGLFASLVMKWHAWRTESQGVNEDSGSLKRDVVGECL